MMKIAFQLLTTLIFLALSPAIVLGVLIVGVSAIWRKAKPAVKLALAPSAKSDTASVPIASDPEVVRNTHIETPWGDVDWAKVAVCDPTKKVGSS